MLKQLYYYFDEKWMRFTEVKLFKQYEAKRVLLNF